MRQSVHHNQPVYHRLLKRLFGIALWVVWVTPASADVLQLHNGDRINGALQAVLDGKLSWKSDAFGLIAVEQSQVKLIESRTVFQVRINRDEALSNCLFMVKRKKQVFYCDEDTVVISDWKLVSSVDITPLIERDAGELTGTALVSFRSSTGNNVQQTTILDSEAHLRFNKTRHSGYLDYAFDEVTEITTRDDSALLYMYDWFFAEKVFLNANAGLSQNRFKDIDLREEYGFGVGYQFYETQLINLLAQIGLAHIREELIVDDDRELDAMRWRLATSWEFSNGYELFHNHGFLQSLDNASDYEFRSDTGLNLPINGWLSSVVKFEYLYDNQPSGVARNRDRIWSLGLSYDW